MYGFEVAMVLISVAAGACLMAWHEKDKQAAVARERKTADGLRIQLNELRISGAYQRGLVSGSRSESVRIDLDRIQAHQTFEEMPEPLLFGPKQEEELRANGRTGMKRTERRTEA